MSPSGPPPILIYLSTLLETTTLNDVKSVLAQVKKNLVEDWIKKEILTITDVLAEIIKQVDPKLGQSCYIISDNPEKVFQWLVDTQQYDNIQTYLSKFGEKKVDYLIIIRNTTPRILEATFGFAKWLYSLGPNMVSTEGAASIFMENNIVQETTAFILEALMINRPEDGYLQTKIFKINL